MARIRRPGFRRLPTVVQQEAKQKGITPGQINEWLRLGLNVASIVSKIPVAAPDTTDREALRALEEQKKTAIQKAAEARAAVPAAPVDLTPLERASVSVKGMTDAERALQAGLLKDVSIADPAAISAAVAGQVRKQLPGRTAEVVEEERRQARARMAALAPETAKFVGITEAPDAGVVPPSIRQEDVAEDVRTEAEALALQRAIEAKQQEAIAAIDEEEKVALQDIEQKLSAVRAAGKRTLRDVLADARRASTPEQQEVLLREVDRLVQPANIGERLGFGMEEKKLKAFSSVLKMFPKATTELDAARLANIASQIEARKEKVKLDAAKQEEAERKAGVTEELRGREVTVKEAREQRQEMVSAEKIKKLKIDNETQDEKNKTKIRLMESQIRKNVQAAKQMMKQAKDNTERGRLKRLSTASANERGRLSKISQAMSTVGREIAKLDRELAKPVGLTTQNNLLAQRRKFQADWNTLEGKRREIDATLESLNKEILGKTIPAKPAGPRPIQLTDLPE